ncbi:MAG: 7-carboxy-7-deazaguanine synthase [Saprospiraceae bacterium]|nr:7-carboxy-7-deazaguanine synthase [Saprospiraceae bacterium]
MAANYKVKEIYYTLQGEGFHSGRPAVFCRFSGCNLWSGREEDRADAICKFCDTDFRGVDGVNGGVYTADSLRDKIVSLYPDVKKVFVVFTGGEPALQLDKALVDTLHDHGIEIAIETNGTLPLPDGIDWVCVSPKANTEIVVVHGDELKLVFPQTEHTPEQFADLNFSHFYLQPKDDGDAAYNLSASVKYCLNHPQWKLSLQTHKIIGID